MNKLLLILPLFLIGCGSGISESASDFKGISEPDSIDTSQLTDTLSADTIVNVELNSWYTTWVDTARTLKKEEDFIIDTNYFFDCNWMADNLIALHSAEVKDLGAVLDDHPVTDGTKWDLRTFYRLDSLKENNQFDAYMAQIDIGMMVESDVFVLDAVKVDSGTCLLIWGLSYSTYEACPFASGQNVYATAVHDKQLLSTVLLGEMMYAGDPPSLMDRAVNGRLTAEGAMYFYTRESHTQEDENGEEFTTLEEDSFAISLVNGVVWY